MTLTLELAPEVEAALQTEAQASGRTVADCAADLLAEALHEAELDRHDVEEAERRLASTKPEEWRTLDELRTAIYGDGKEAKAA